MVSRFWIRIKQNKDSVQIKYVNRNSGYKHQNRIMFMLKILAYAYFDMIVKNKTLNGDEDGFYVFMDNGSIVNIRDKDGNIL